MPYLDKNLTKKIRQEFRARFPEFKFSVRTENHSSMSVTIKSGPGWLAEDGAKESVNHFWIEENYKDEPKKMEFLKEIVSRMKCEQKESFYDGDYGSVPNYYVNLRIGSFEHPYKVTD